MKLLLTLCLLSNPLVCEVKEIKIYNSKQYCEKLGQFELARIMSAYDNFFIKGWKCK